MSMSGTDEMQHRLERKGTRARTVEDARRENSGAILEAVVAAEDAVRDRDRFRLGLLDRLSCS